MSILCCFSFVLGLNTQKSLYFTMIFGHIHAYYLCMQVVTLTWNSDATVNSLKFSSYQVKYNQVQPFRYGDFTSFTLLH